MEVSVIIPTYKPGSYLFDCLNSILKQDFPKDKYELVLGLNGIKNPYFTDINSFFENSEVNYKLFYTQQKGVSHARNMALERINSKYVIFLDDDDILSNNFISGLYSKISANTIVATNVKTFFTDLNCLGDDYITRCYVKCYNKREYSLFNYRGFLSSVCAKMIPFDIINGFRFDEHLHVGEDAVFMFTISRNINNIKLSEQNIIYYRRLRQGSASRIKLTFFVRIRNLLQSLLKYSKVYFSEFNKYNFLLFISRLAAVVKCFLSS
jgi:glycosyltransferase involved in cell wall biosynthesis